LSIDDVISLAAHIGAVGTGPTSGAIANAVIALATNPAVLGQLRDHPGRLRAAAHELLRYDSPTHMVPRFAAIDTVAAGRRIRRGDAVLAMVGAANRDPAVFPAPDELDITRDARRQLGFGQGAHICLGAPLGLEILEAAVGALARRFEHLELVSPPVYAPNVELRIPDRVMLRNR
jgi:cytochrome P450